MMEYYGIVVYGILSCILLYNLLNRDYEKCHPAMYYLDGVFFSISLATLCYKLS